MRELKPRVPYTYTHTHRRKREKGREEGRRKRNEGASMRVRKGWDARREEGKKRALRSDCWQGLK